MAIWQVDFEIIPQKMLRGAPRPLTQALVTETPWWKGSPLPADYRAQLDAVVPRGRAGSADLESWGLEDGNRVDVRSAGGEITHVSARVDVRRLDARFGAALLGLVRRLGAALVRRDGLIVEPTIGAFAAALRDSPAWVSANDPAAWLAAQERDADADE